MTSSPVSWMEVVVVDEYSCLLPCGRFRHPLSMPEYPLPGCSRDRWVWPSRVSGLFCHPCTHTHASSNTTHTHSIPQWVNLCVDMGSLVSGLFRSQRFKSLEAISVGGSCMLRRIFTLRGPPPDTVSPLEETEGVEEIPRVYQMPGTSVAVETQVSWLK